MKKNNMKEAFFDFYKFINHPFVNKAQVAAAMFPGHKRPSNALNNKLSELQRNKVTHKDIQAFNQAIVVFLEETKETCK